MNKTTKITAEKPEAKRNNKVSIAPKKERLKTKVVPAVDQILSLQRTIGNQEVQRLFESGALQAKLKVGKSGDKYEREADMIADKVMRMPEMTECLECNDNVEESLQTKPIRTQITPLIRRQVEHEEEEEELIQGKFESSLLQKQIEPEEEEEKPVQTKSNGSSTAEVTSSVESSINSLKGGGQPLSESTRKYFEPRFGSDFSQVRIHTNSQAGNIARSINAKAFTTGQDVFLNGGQYSPETSGGKRLLAHELTHVVQQNQGIRLKEDKKSIQVTNISDSIINREAGSLPYPGVIARCRAMRVPCPVPFLHHGTVCRLAGCNRDLPVSFSSPGVCIYHCIDGRICSCVLFGTDTSAVCVLTLCDRPGQAGTAPDYESLTRRAVAMAEQRYGNRGRSSRSEESRPQTLQAKFNIDNPFAGAFEDIIIQRTNMTAGGFSYADSAQEISAYQAGNWKPATLDFNHTAGNGFVATSSITSFLHEIDTAADGSISTINLIGHGTTAGFIFSGARNAGNTDFGMNTGTSLSWSNLLRSGYINDDNRTSPLRSKFARDATMTFYACRSGNDDRFLQSIADFFGVTARGFVNPVYWCITYNSDTTTWSPRGHTAYPGPCGGAGQRGFSHLSPDLTRTPEV